MTRRRLWLQWVLASAVGCAVVSTVARRVSMAAGGAAGDVMGPLVAEVVVGALALGGVMLGIAVGQWLVVRRLVPWAGRLLLAITGGAAAAGAVGLGLLAALSDIASPSAGVVVAVVVGLAAFGTTQWLVLRGPVPGAGRWALASLAGLAAASFSMGVVGAVAEQLTGDVIGQALFGAIYAAVAGYLPISAAAGHREGEET
ncbi:MAG: hypothetical protein OXE96_06010 [Gemmatimonadetes bacterium]|nr:hypothetical protein [Gemmatimonadota bacterium]